eukprot:7391097-Prymnesium_polylepis.1
MVRTFAQSAGAPVSSVVRGPCPTPRHARACDWSEHTGTGTHADSEPKRKEDGLCTLRLTSCTDGAMAHAGPCAQDDCVAEAYINRTRRSRNNCIAPLSQLCPVLRMWECATSRVALCRRLSGDVRIPDPRSGSAGRPAHLCAGWGGLSLPMRQLRGVVSVRSRVRAEQHKSRGAAPAGTVRSTRCKYSCEG